MATASKTTVKKEVVTHVEETQVVLALTEGEAKFLRFLLQFVGGVPNTTPRNHADVIEAALHDAGVGFPSYYSRGNGGSTAFASVDPQFYFGNECNYTVEDIGK
jgi:hypothetical protein